MTTKKELVTNAIKHIKSYDEIKGLNIEIELKDGDWIRHYYPIYKWKKYTKEEWCIRTVSSAIRNNPFDETRPSVWQANLNISNIKSLKVRIES